MRVVLVLAVVVSVFLCPVSAEDDFAGPELTLTALERMRGPFAYPAKLKTPELLNAALSGLRIGVNYGVVFRSIKEDATDEEAVKIFKEEFEKALKYAKSVTWVHKLAPAFFATRVMLASLNRSHTKLIFFENDLDKQMKLIKEGREALAGPGVVFSMTEDAVFVDRIFSGTKTSKIGLKRFDELVEIGDRENPTADLLAFVGAPGSVVPITVRRQGELMRFDLPRENIESVPAEWRELTSERGKILYFSFYSFEDDIPRQLRFLISDKKPRGLIIDIRGNIGGSNTSLDPCISMFVPPGSVLYVGESQVGFAPVHSQRNSEPYKLPMVILTDRNSRSSAEIFAAVLAEYGKAVVVGEKTAGEVERARIISLPLAAYMSVTNGDITTPRGKKLEKFGVVPEDCVSLTREHIAQGRDIQLERAFEVAVSLIID